MMPGSKVDVKGDTNSARLNNDAQNSSYEQGREATSPWKMPWPAWKQVLIRTGKETSADSVSLVAAGVSFYGFLALLPLLGATVLAYGLFAEPITVMRNMSQMAQFMPDDIARFVGEQLMYVVQSSQGKKGVGVMIAMALALFSARNGAAAIVTALNIAYEEEEKRGFFKVNLLALTITVVAVALAVVALLAVTIIARIEACCLGRSRCSNWLSKRSLTCCCSPWRLAQRRLCTVGARPASEPDGSGCRPAPYCLRSVGLR